MEYNVSSFRGEMKELAYLTANITSRTLAVLDELGRGTSNIEGLSLAFATAEWLAMRPAFTLFVTHFPQLFVLPSMYPGTRSVHMQTTGRELSFIHKVGSGPSELQSGYGVKMARLCGFPPALVDRAEALRIQVQLRHPLVLTQARPESSETVAGALLHYLTLLGASSLTGAALRAALSALRARVQPAAMQALLEKLSNVVSPVHATASGTLDGEHADKRQRTNIEASNGGVFDEEID
jgi:DNA mismatch repair ATPase MutS